MKKALKAMLWAGAGATAVAAANTIPFARAKALGNTLEGEGRFWTSSHGDVFYTRQGKGVPVVLLHGIYAGASGYEWRRNFDVLSEHYNIFAPDWLGFGLSDKPRLRYTDALYIEQLKGFLNDVVREPCYFVASSLAAAYAIRFALDLPNQILGLVLICPTGYNQLKASTGPAAEASYQLLHSPVLGTAIYNGLTSQPSLRWYLMNETYFDPSFVGEQMIDHYTTASHQYGCQNALPSFISGLLNHDIRDAFPALPQKTIRIVWGREARMSPLSDAEAFLADNPRAELTVFDKSGLLLHDEQAQAFNRLVVETINANAPVAAKTRSRRPKSEQKEPRPQGE